MNQLEAEIANYRQSFIALLSFYRKLNHIVMGNENSCSTRVSRIIVNLSVWLRWKKEVFIVQFGHNGLEKPISHRGSDAE